MDGWNGATARARIDRAAIELRRALALSVRSSLALTERANALTATYQLGGTAPRLDDSAAVDAYAAARMPATFVAAAHAMTAAAELARSFAPTSHLDIGAGTGAAAWAARGVWPSIRAVSLIDREPAVIDLGRRLATASGDAVLASADWRLGRADDPVAAAAELVTAGYVLGELPADAFDAAVDALWAATHGVLVVVEPGSRAGFQRVVAVRDRLIAAGAHVVAPCPGPEPCPVLRTRTAWCHFLARLDRSPLQRRAKTATRSWEDEPFSYVALARPAIAADPVPRVVLGRPRRRPGAVELRICADGRIERRILSRRDGPTYHAARDLVWGDPVSPSIRIAGANET